MNVDCSDLTTRKISTPTKHAQRTVFTNKTWPKSGQNPLRIWRSATASAQLCKSVDLYSTKRKLTNIQYRHLPCEYRTDSHQTSCAHSPCGAWRHQWRAAMMPKPHRKQRWPTSLAYNPKAMARSAKRTAFQFALMAFALSLIVIVVVALGVLVVTGKLSDYPYERGQLVGRGAGIFATLAAATAYYWRKRQG